MLIVSVRSNRVLFGPGLLGSVGKFCQFAEDLPTATSNYSTNPPKAKENVESCLSHCSLARSWYVLNNFFRIASISFSYQCQYSTA